ncbi:MAG TPA: hypothetical protein VMZ71_13880 [Gemmataceae bacterium]|nr:hypothetical protein [Gemmataceae bacterium]
MPDFFLFEEALRNRAYVAVGDVDAFADIIGGGPGGGPRVLVLSGKDLIAPAPSARVVANFFAGNTDNRSGIRVTTRNLDDDGFADIVVGDGAAAGSRVTAYLGTDVIGGSDRAALAFDAFPGSLGGVFVG